MEALWIRFLVLFGRLLSHPQLWKRFLLHPFTRYVAAWLIALGGAGASMYFAWTAFDEANRNDQNDGHTTIDFGGQYLMGRMLVRGYGQHLYHRQYQRRVLHEAYPRADENPSQERSDAENLMTWIMGEDDHQAAETQASFVNTLAGSDPLGAAVLLTAGQAEWTPERIERIAVPAVGGPLYPPVNSFVYYPLALLPPRWAYRGSQIANVLLAFVAGLGACYLSRGRIWWPVAAGVVLAFPGFNGSLNLGQNAALTFAVVTWGWALIARGHPGCGGIVWGFLAFKPVWALSFFLVPVLSRRWRVCLAMAGTGAALAALTLPFVGLHSWQEWLQIGTEGTQTYKYDSNWIHLSRDLLSMPRRWLDFSDQVSWTDRRDNFLATLQGCVLLAAVFELTARVAVLRWRKAHDGTGPGAAFLLLAAWLCSFHFMYYDFLLVCLPVFVLSTDWRRYLEPLYFLVLIPLTGKSLDPKLTEYYRPRFVHDYPPPAPFLQTRYGHVWVINRMVPSLVALLAVVVYVYPATFVYLADFPYDTICVSLLWLWCAWLWLRAPARPEPPPETTPKELTPALPVHAPKLVQLGADVNGPHQRLAHEHRADPDRLQA
jgi:arabinofuranan 3-O-arabinosyltransferase